MGLSDPLKKANRATYQSLIAAVLELDPARVSEPILEPGEADRAHAARVRAEFGHVGGLVGLNTGAGGRWEYKQWTEEHQIEFARLATAAGAGVVLLGGPAEAERHVRLCNALHGRAVFDGGNHNSFGEFAALTELCDVVVTGDTFALHVAAARRVPTVVLFGPTSAAEIELFGRGRKIVPEGLDCLVCYLPKCDVMPHCQARILPETVWRAASELLGDQP
jgi:ADP-heptose:LPS heptosyltransferase